MKLVAPASLVLLLVVSACGSSSDTSGESSNDTSVDVEIVASPGQVDTTDSDPESTAPVATDPVETTTTTTLVPVRNTLAGVWRAPAEDILAANLANIGGAAAACVGDIVMTLGADGSFSREGSMRCSIDGEPFSGQVVNSSGRWEATADSITVTVTESNGYAEASGPNGSTRVPLPDSGYGSASYTVNATTLTITFTDPSVGTVTQVYTRD